ncbi:sigma-54-dependent transcriptional regulator [Flavobacterium ardleyense]|uniref:sigma-54-dependent transcriptional regulator n=1 Tax=Flavobacterium ardleyense TaxID=2038737 RepID=UPI00298D0630|nr:sigma-54 dependent transcriptional regulator [Flavobacterium ardleyense]
MNRILVIDDDVAFCKMLSSFLTRNHYDVQTAYSAQSAKELAAEHSFDLFITDLRLPDDDGIDLMVNLLTQFPTTPVILMTGYSDVATAVKALKNGASDYITKPLNPEEVLLVVAKILNDKTVPETKNEQPKPTDKKSNSEYVLGVSETSRQLAEHIDLVGPTDISVLIIGESGTGKEVIAANIHKKSSRSNKAFVAVDCGTIPKDLAASEFFGHQKGSFTGAVNDKIGYFEAANGGTIFLDEIGNLSYENQVQLLRALQERKIKPVGSNKEIAVDIRVICATNEDLRTAVKNGTFREDLYHRINEFSISSPALRDRGADLMVFAEFFLHKSNEQLNRELVGFSSETIAIFQRYKWPGNLREMQNVIKRATLLSKGDFIETSVLPQELFDIEISDSDDLISISDNEKAALINALEMTNNNKSEAAKLLQINRKTLYNKIKKYDLDY